MLWCDRHVAKALKALVKGVQANEDVDEDELEEMVRHFYPQYESANGIRTARQGKGAAREGIPGKSKSSKKRQIQGKQAPRIHGQFA